MAKKRYVKVVLAIDWDEYEDVSSEMLIVDLLDYITIPFDDVKVIESKEVTTDYEP